MYILIYHYLFIYVYFIFHFYIYIFYFKIILKNIEVISTCEIFYCYLCFKSCDFVDGAVSSPIIISKCTAWSSSELIVVEGY